MKAGNSRQVFGAVFDEALEIFLLQEPGDHLAYPIGGVDAERAPGVPWRYLFGIGHNALKSRGGYLDVDMNGEPVMGSLRHCFSPSQYKSKKHHIRLEPKIKTGLFLTVPELQVK
jgi:hypothetical protein